MKKRFLAMLMAVVMLIGIIPTGVVAEDADVPAEITYGSYNEKGEWVPGEDTITSNGITLSKNAVRTGENTYEVTLRAETSTTTSTVAASAATVLVIDVSGSMAYCADCGAERSHGWNSNCPQKDMNSGRWTSRMAAAKAAAISFLDSYCDAPANSGRYVSIVKFSTNGSLAQDWIDVSGGKGNANYNTVVRVINGLSANGGTNLDDGLYDANAQFNKSAVSRIKNKFTVALTDGVPTFARGGIGGGSNGSSAINNATAATAATLRGTSKVYTVCFGVANERCYNGGPTVGSFLSGSIATSGCAYNADNASQLYSAFASITEDITSGLVLGGSVVTDPMGEVVGSFVASGVTNMDGDEGFTWTLGDASVTESTDENGNLVKTYVYTKTYTVHLDDSETNDHGGYYPLNEVTTLTLEDGTVLQFPVPAVHPLYTVIYQKGANGILVDGEGKQVDEIKYEGLKRYEDTPAEPDVIANDTHYFTGWSPVVVNKVTKSVTYVAQYASKTAVTIIGHSGTKTYNGSEQSVDTFEVSGLPEGYTLTNVTYKAARTEVGTSDGAFTGAPVIMKGEENVTHQFKITQTPGTMTITPLAVNVTIVGNTDSQVYNGAEQSVTGYTATDDSTLYSEEDFTFSGEATAKGTNVGTYPMGLAADQFTNKNSNFTVTFSVTDGSLEITKKSVTLTSATANKVYDGQPLKAESVTAEGFVNGEGADYSNFAEITNVGNTNNTFTYKLKNGTSADNYDITVKEGTLTVNADTDATISITPYKGMYDGAAHDALTSVVLKNHKGEKIGTEGWTIIYVVDGKEYTQMPTIKDVGTLPVTVKASNSNYKALEATDIAEVTPRKVTLTSATASQEYNGQPLKAESVEVTGDGFVEGEGATYSNFASITDVGEIDNTFAYALKSNTKAANYEIEVVEGTLTVKAKPAQITITADSNEKVYDGTALTDNGYIFTDKVLEEGDVLTAVVEGTITDAGEVANVVTSYKVMRDEVDVTKNYTFAESVNGTLIVTKRPVTMTSATAEKVYDGTALTDSDVTANGFVDGEGATYNVTGSQTVVGSSANTFTYTLNKNTKAANYEITKTEGILTVTPLTGVVVTITENSGTKVYNGAEQQVTGYVVTDISNDLYTEADFSFTGDATAKGTNVGTYNMELKPEDFTNTNKNFENVTFVIVDGQLEITPLTGVVVTITENSDTKVYNGKEQTVEGYEVTKISSELYTEKDFTFDGAAVAKGTTVGKYDMGVTDDMFTNTNENFKDVKFIINDGQLTITPITDEIVITADSDSKVYDGTALIDAEYTFTEDVLMEGDVLTAIVEGTITDVGSVANKVTSWKIMRGDVDVSDCYTGVKTVDGTLSITKRTVTLTSATDSKVYDGTALTNDEITVGGDGFVEGEGAAYNVTGSQTVVGTSKNTFTYTLNENTKAGNYDITAIEGTLTVTKKGEIVVTITENSGVYFYDGTEKVVEGYTISINDPLYTEEDFEFEGEAVVKGTYVGEYDMELTPEDFVNINENFEDVTFVIVDGTLTIKPIETVIDITADSSEKVYDGTPLTDDGYTYTQNVLVEGDELVVVVEGTITDAGTVENEIVSYQVLRTVAGQRATEDVTECYTFGEIVNGTLTVTPRDVIITSGSDTKVYDGTPLTNYDITAEGFVEGEGAMVTFTGSQLNAGTSENTFTYVFAENTKAENYTVIIVNGKLEVTPKAVTITSGSATKNYDGEPLTCDKIVAEGFVEGEGAEYTITGSQTEVGTGKNTFTYKLNKNTLAENYVITLVEGDLVVEPPIEIPDTGDNTNLVLYTSLMITSAAAFVSMLVLGKKKGKYSA